MPTPSNAVRAKLNWFPLNLGDRQSAVIASGGYSDLLLYTHQPAPTPGVPQGDADLARGFALSRLPGRNSDPRAAVAARVSELGALTGFVIACAGFDVSNTTTGKPTGAVRVDWKVSLVTDCAVDDDPVYEGSTFLASAIEKRQGLLVQVSNVLATGVVLAAQCTAAGGEIFGLSAVFSLRVVEGTMGGGSAQVRAGPVIG
jgi:hypothetical protein